MTTLSILPESISPDLPIAQQLHALHRARHARWAFAERQRALPAPVARVETPAAVVLAPKPVVRDWLLLRSPLDRLFAKVAEGERARDFDLKIIHVRQIQKAVSQKYGVSIIDINSARRTVSIVWPRQIAVYLAKMITLKSLPEIGQKFGGRDHTTVLHAVRKVGARVASDPEFAAEIEALRAAIVGAASC